jgi:hypothetical protein
VFGRPRRPRPRRSNFWRRLHWGWVLVPLVLILATWIATGIRPSVSFQEIAAILGVHHVDRYARLALLGLVVVAIVAIARIMRKR